MRTMQSEDSSAAAADARGLIQLSSVYLNPSPSVPDEVWASVCLSLEGSMACTVACCDKTHEWAIFKAIEKIVGSWQLFARNLDLVDYHIVQTPDGNGHHAWVCIRHIENDRQGDQTDRLKDYAFAQAIIHAINKFFEV